MVWELLSNPVLVSVAVLLALAALRMNVVFALISAAAVGGMMGGLDGEAFALLGSGEFTEFWKSAVSVFGSTMKSFQSSLDNGAVLAINYVMLGTFSIAISRSGVTELIARKLFQWIGCEMTAKKLFCFKYALLGILTLMAVSSQNLIPMHIAFIPVLIPPLLPVFDRLRLDRRAVACVLTFGLITPYMVLPVGFGKIYLNTILLDNIRRNGMEVAAAQASPAMLIPALGMVAGLLIAVFLSYRRPRAYNPVKTELMVEATEPVEIRPFNVAVGVAAILMALFVQIFLDSLLIGSLLAVMVFVAARVIRLRDTQDVFVQGVHLMGGIGIVMIAAAGFANVMKDTGGVAELVELVKGVAVHYRGGTVFAMLLIGLIITMGIGSSFSTVPLIAAIYVPLCAALGISPLATIAIVGSARSARRRRLPGVRIGARSDRRAQRRRAARSYLRLDDSDLSALQSAASGGRVDRRNDSVIRRKEHDIMFGFYRLAAAVPKLKVADAAFNTEELRRCFRQAAENGADAVVFPELCVTGYSCGDLFFQERLLAAAEAAAVDFAARTAGQPDGRRHRPAVPPRRRAFQRRRRRRGRSDPRNRAEVRAAELPGILREAAFPLRARHNGRDCVHRRPGGAVRRRPHFRRRCRVPFRR